MFILICIIMFLHVIYIFASKHTSIIDTPLVYRSPSLIKSKTRVVFC